MTTITTRAGKGAPLTNAELDANFTNLNANKLEVGTTTTDIAEGTNQYFTNARARSALSAVGPIGFNSATGVISFSGNTDSVSEGTTNQYFTQARARSSLSAGTGISYNSTTGVISSSITQYTDALARAALSQANGTAGYNSTTGVITIPSTTAHITEGSNLYYTDTRVRAALSAGTGISFNSTTGAISSTITQYTDALARAAHSYTAGAAGYNSTTGVITIPSTTAHITEGSNLYYTDARARAALSAGTGISYNSTTGAITSSITQYTDALARAALSAGTGISYNSTTGVISSSVTAYTDAQARAALSFTAGSGAYNSTTGVITIPTNTNQLTNGAGFLTGITSGQVTTALGYTPMSNAGGNMSGNLTLTGGYLSVTGSNYPVNVNSSNSALFKFVMQDAGTTRGYFGASSTYSFYAANASGSAMFHSDQSGNFTSIANITAYSDERLKKNWSDLQPGFIASLAKVKMGTYERTDCDIKQVGVSAQSLQEVLPEAVHEDMDGMLSVAYGQAALSSAVALARKVVELEERLKVLEAR